MAAVAYKSWSLIPRDAEPRTQEPTAKNPPMIPNMAVDAGASLQFDVDTGGGELEMHVSATGMSAEGRAEGDLEIYSGASGRLQPVEATWRRGQDGPNAVLTARFRASGPCVKLHLPAGATLVVTGVAFEA